MEISQNILYLVNEKREMKLKKNLFLKTRSLMGLPLGTGKGTAGQGPLHPGLVSFLALLIARTLGQAPEPHSHELLSHELGH